MKEVSKQNTSRSKTFGIVINPKNDNRKIEWKSLTNNQIALDIKQLGLPNKFELTQILNNLEIENVNKSLTSIEDFEGQFELGSETQTPHYQLAVMIKSLCTKNQVLKALQNAIEAFINVDIQYNFKEMVKYCSKDSEFISEEYSGRIYKHQWKMNFIDRKPELKTVMDKPYPWQSFFLNQILKPEPDSRIVDWLIDPIGNTGKSSFARAYISQEPTNAILIKIDNLDRMELALILKIRGFRDRYNEDPKIIFFDFPRAVDPKKVIAATALMEDAKSGHLETNFGGRHDEIQIGNIHVVVLANTAPDLSQLSVDRWRIWRLGGQNFNNVIWPCQVIPTIISYDRVSKQLAWIIELTCLPHGEISKLQKFKGLNLENEWFHTKAEITKGKSEPIFGANIGKTKLMINSWTDAPNHVKQKLFKALKSDGKLLEFDSDCEY